MNRTECELAISEHLKAIFALYRECVPDGKDFSISYREMKNGNGNDFGNWSTREFHVSGDGVGFELWINVDDDRYRGAMGDEYTKPEWVYCKGQWSDKGRDYE